MEKFTTSEMAIMAWSSQEQMADLGKDKGTRNRLEDLKETQDFLKDGIGNPNYEQDRYNEFSQSRGPVTDEGDVDLRQFTGKQIWNYFRSQGIVFPIIQRSKPPEKKE